MNKITHPQKTRFSAASLFSTLVLGFLGLSAPTAAQAQDLPVVSEQPSNLELPALPDLGGALVFGATPVGDVTGTRRVISVENPNEAEITITPALVNWTMNGGDIHSDTGDFAFEPASLTLAAGASADLTLYFRPKTSNTKPGLRRCALQLSSDDEASHRIMLSGYTALPGGIAWVSNSGCHTLALKSDGSLWGCGYQRQGQLGSNLNVDGFYRATSYHLIIPSGVASIAACGAGLVVENDQVGGGGRTGGSFSLILMADGSLWGMGLNHRGQLGLGSKTNVMSPTRILAAGAASMSGSASHSMVIKCDGSLWACGSNNCGQLGLGSADTNDHLLLEPMRFDHQGDELKGIIAVSAAESSALATPGYLGNLPTLGNAFSDYAHGLILKASGELLALGYNGLGQLSVGDNTNRAIPTPCVNDQGQPMIHVVGMAAATINSYALQYNTETVNGVAQTQYRFSTVGGVTGVNSTSGELGINTRSASNRFLRPGLPAGITPRLPLSTHSGGALWIGSDGNGYANGAARYFQLGQDNSVARTTPSAIVNNAAALISGPNSQLSIVLGQDGSLSGTGLRIAGTQPNYFLAGSKPLNGNMGELAEVGGVRDFTRQPVRFAQPARARYLSAAAGAAFSLDLRRRIIGGLPGADAAANTYNFALKAGSSLPSGFTLQNGLLSSSDVGAASATTSSFILQVTNDGNTQEATFEFAAMEISTAADLGLVNTATPTSKTLTALGGVGAKTWSVAEGSSLPEGLTLDPSTGAISGTALDGGSYRFTINCQDSATPPTVLSREFSLAVAGISTNSKLPAIRLGQSFTPITFTAVHTTAPVTWTMTSGSLPAGLSFDPATATLSGNLSGSSSGAYTFTLQISDGATPALVCSKTFSLAIIEILNNATLPAGGTNVPYSQALIATCTGSTLAWSVPTGSSLPTGLTLAADGSLSGTPTSAGNHLIRVKVSVPSGSFLTADFTIRVMGISTPRKLPSQAVGRPYSTNRALAAEFNSPTGSLTWEVAPGSSLPTGLVLSSAGEISGSPQTSIAWQRFSLQVTDNELNASARKEFSITIFGTSNSRNLPLGRAGFDLAYTLNTIGGKPPVRYALAPDSGSLPAGLTLAETGVLSGNISDWGGSYDFKIAPSDSSTPNLTSKETLTLTVFGPKPFTPPASLKVGQYYSQFIAFAPYTNPDQSTYRMAIQATGNQPLPAGITIDARGHFISGRFTTAGTHGFRLVITDSSGYQAFKDNITFNVISAPYLIVEDPASTPATEFPLNSGQVLLPTAAQSGSSPVKTLRLRNGGDQALSNPKLSISGSNQADFSVTLLAADNNPAPTTLAAGASASLLIQFAPKAGVAGLRTATLTISATPPQGQTLAPVVMELRAYTSPSGGIASMAAGQQHSLFLKGDGSVWVSGDNSSGQLGTGDNNASNKAKLSLHHSAAAVAAAGNHSLIQMGDGSLWAMGNNSSGQLGLGATTAVNTPTRVIEGGVAAVATGNTHSLILKSDGSVWVSGGNSNGQLGTGNNSAVNVFTKILPDSAIAIAAGDNHSLVLLSNGDLLAFGLNSDGQLGLGNLTSVNRPTTSGLSAVVGIAAGGNHSLALKKDGSLHACGNNAVGQLGITGAATNATTWTAVVGCDSGVQSMAAGASHSLILKSTGIVLACGSNSSGQLSGGDASSSTPRALSLPADSLAAAVAAGSNHSLILTIEGNLLVLGANAQGQLGLGTNEAAVTTASSLAASSSGLAELPAAIFGLVYRGNVAGLSIGGTIPIRYALKSGSSAPAGLSLGSDGILTGTPTMPGTYTIEVVATDPASPAVGREISLSLSVFGISTTALAQGTWSLDYSQALQIAGGTEPYTYEVVSNADRLQQLPAGLALGANAQSQQPTISGRPTAAGNYRITIKATDSSQPARVSFRSFDLPIFGITNDSVLPPARLNSPYQVQLRPANVGSGPYTFSLAAGSTLPSWLSLDPRTGVLSGMPTNITSDTGLPKGDLPDVSFSITLTDLSKPLAISTTQPFSLALKESFLTIEDRSGSPQNFWDQSTQIIGGCAPGERVSRPFRLINRHSDAQRKITAIELTGRDAQDFSTTLPSAANLPLVLINLYSGNNSANYRDFTVTFRPRRGSQRTRQATMRISAVIYPNESDRTNNRNGVVESLTVSFIGQVMDRPAETQTLSFINPGTVVAGQGALPLRVLSSSALPVSLTVTSSRSSNKPAGPVASLSGTPATGYSLTPQGPGSITLSATQNGDDRYAAAKPLSITLNIAAAAAAGKISLSNLVQVFNGSPRPITVLPAQGSATITYSAGNTRSTTAPTAAGSYGVEVRDNTNKVLATAKLTILPAPAYLKATSLQRRILQSNPALSFTTQDTAGADLNITWTTQPTLGTTANQSSPAGNYPILLTNKPSAANYNIIFTPGVLSVEGFGSQHQAMVNDPDNGKAVGLLTINTTGIRTVPVDIKNAQPTYAISFSASLRSVFDGAQKPGLLSFAGLLNLDSTKPLDEAASGSNLSDAKSPKLGFSSISLNREGSMSGTLTYSGKSYPFNGKRLREANEINLAASGAHSLIIEPALYASDQETPAGSNAPQGYGYASALLDGKGTLTLAGRLGDGNILTAALPADISLNPGYRLFLQPYSRADSTLAGSFELTAHALSGRQQLLPVALRWSKTAGSKDGSYPMGFVRSGAVVDLFCLAYMEPWQAPQTKPPLITLLNRWGVSSGSSKLYTLNYSNPGNAQPSPLQASINLSDKNVLSAGPGAPAGLRLSLNPTTGVITGSLPSGKSTINFSGILRQPTDGSERLLGAGQLVIPAVAPGKPTYVEFDILR